MGWSCTRTAGDTLDRLTAACVRQTGSQNTFRAPSARYFWEHDRIEHDDGRITGQVFECVGRDRCRQVLDFTITADGHLVGGHYWMRRAVGAR